MSKQLIFNDAVRQALLKGIETVARAVTLTLGPRGRNVIIEQQFGQPSITKDGVTVAKAIALEDPYENIGARMLIEVAGKTNDVSGDGTTTTVLLAEAIYREGIKNLVAGANPMELKSGIEIAVRDVVAQLRSFAKPIQGKDEIAQIASIAANGDIAVGLYISEAVDKVGKDGIITIEQSKTTDTSIDIVDGTRFGTGYLSPYFVTDQVKQEAVLLDPYIFLYEKKLMDLKAFVTVMEAVQKTGAPLLVVADDLEATVLTTMVVNKVRSTFQSCAVKAPSFGNFRKDILQDLAVLTGGTAITEDLGIKLDTVTLQQLGRAKKVIVTKDTTTIVEGYGKKADIESRIALIRRQKETEQSDFNREKLQERLARLVGGVAVINIGATTETELKEKTYRIEDALQATQAAIQEGIVPGGGTAFIKCLTALDATLARTDLTKDELAGVAIIKTAIKEPVKKIAANGGKEGATVLEKLILHHHNPPGTELEEANFGYNARTDTYGDLIAAGVVDPVKVTRVALENAASIAGLLLTTDCAIVEIKKKEPADPLHPTLG